ncbi:MAG: hypothetical protein CMA14_02445 [Euryarchaeota archaeon]|nr:hypothetical protein [Euryarchaeota archaeon]OUW78986.1 MAG: hypothetical protein CBD75_01785 [Euryarchaeota archaeon TMED215]|tara:strand:- start:203 stop:1060 length:858 start_codon:yes stop_codon:yes gene_type:complete
MNDHWKGIPNLPNSIGEEKLIRVSNSVSLRVFVWEPVNQSSKVPILMVPGWGSVFEGWRPLVTEWVQNRKIIYVETREKASAIFDEKMNQKDFHIDSFTDDIREIIQSLNLDGNYHLFSSSLGSTILIHGLQERKISAKSSIFLAPNQNIRFPLWARLLIKLPLPKFTLKWLIKLAIWAVERKVEEEGQKIRYRRTLLSQNYERIRFSARYLIGYSLPESLSNIEIPCAILTAESDKLHGTNDVEFISREIPNMKIIPIPSNQYAHQPEALDEIESFYSNMELDE